MGKYEECQDCGEKTNKKKLSSGLCQDCAEKKTDLTPPKPPEQEEEQEEQEISVEEYLRRIEKTVIDHEERLRNLEALEGRRTM